GCSAARYLQTGAERLLCHSSWHDQGPGLLGSCRNQSPTAGVASAPLAVLDVCPLSRSPLPRDLALLREGVRLLLERSGFEVVGEASDGAQAVELTASLAPDVLVLDMSMPKLNGVEAARLIRHGNPSVKMVLLTMHRDEGELLEAL